MMSRASGTAFDRAGTERRSGQILAELALLLPLYAILFWTLGWLVGFGAARLGAETAARQAAFAPRGARGAAVPAARRVARERIVRDVHVRSEEGSGRPAWGTPGGRALAAAFAAVFPTRRGAAHLSCDPLPYPYPGRPAALEPEAAFVFDPVVPASPWFGRSLFRMKEPPSLPLAD